jgi:hypothetical protein
MTAQLALVQADDVTKAGIGGHGWYIAHGSLLGLIGVSLCNLVLSLPGTAALKSAHSSRRYLALMPVLPFRYLLHLSDHVPRTSEGVYKDATRVVAPEEPSELQNQVDAATVQGCVAGIGIGRTSPFNMSLLPRTP